MEVKLQKSEQFNIYACSRHSTTMVRPPCILTLKYKSTVKNPISRIYNIALLSFSSLLCPENPKFRLFREREGNQDEDE